MLAIWASHPVLAQERFGSLSGIVTDASKAAVPGATVTATNAQTGATRIAISGAEGTYRLPDLEPGRYGVTIELQGFQKAIANEVLVLVGKDFSVNAELRPGAVTETVNVTAETSRQIDVRGVTISHSITSDEFDRLPKTRSFQSMAFALPAVTQGDLEGGIQIHGASSAENSFTVDGVVTNSVINGKSRQNTVFEYLDEVQVKTTGVPAEYGGALGGVVSAVTKSGGNKFTGESHYLYQGDKLSAAPVNRLVLNPSDNVSTSYVQEPRQSDYRNEVGGSLGGPIIRDRLFFFGSASPQFVRRTNTYLFSSGTEEGDIARKQTVTNAFGKLTYTGGPLRVAGSLLYSPTNSTGTLPSYNGVGPRQISSSKAGNATQIDQGFKNNQYSTAIDADITLTNSSFVTVRGGYFYDGYKDTGVSLTPSVTYQASSVGLAGVPANLQQPSGFLNTPRVSANLKDNTNQGYFNADYNHVLSVAGFHQIKGGFGIRRTVNDVDISYPGGYTFIWWDAAYTSTATQRVDRGTYGYYEVNDFGTRGKVGANILSLYIQDQWTIGRRLTLNLGVRSENEKIPTFQPEVRKYAFDFGFGEKIAPRLGVAYDLSGDGRFKVFGSWGRYYDWTIIRSLVVPSAAISGIPTTGRSTIQMWCSISAPATLPDATCSIPGTRRIPSRIGAPRRSMRSIRTSSRCIRTAPTPAWSTNGGRTPSSLPPTSTTTCRARLKTCRCC